jgi:hypothetical protein
MRNEDRSEDWSDCWMRGILVKENKGKEEDNIEYNYMYMCMCNIIYNNSNI